MYSERWLGQLSKTDRKAVEFMKYGETVAAGKLVSDPVSPEASVDEVPRSFNFPERMRSGEALLGSLGLVPKAKEDGSVKPRSGIILISSPTASSLTIVFNGNSRMFALPSSLVTVVDTHILLVRDPSRCFGFLGIPELGDDYEVCLENFNRIMTALAVDKLYCVGLSAGGASAIKVGCDLMARGMIGFSIPTTLNLDDDTGAELKHYPQLARLYRNARHLGIDLAKYYAEKSPRPSVILTYSAGHLRDSWLAQRMNNIPGVELINTEGFTGHSTYIWLRDNDKLDPFFERLFTLEPISPCVQYVDQDNDGASGPVDPPRLLASA